MEKLDLVDESVRLRDLLEKENLKDKSSKQKLQATSLTGSRSVEALRDSSNKCEWMILDVHSGHSARPAAARAAGQRQLRDERILNDLYRRIINRNNRLKKLVDFNAPEVIIRNEKRMLQQSVDALFDNNRCKRPVLGSAATGR